MTHLRNDTLDREQVELLLSLDGGEGDVLAEIVVEFESSGAELTTQIVSAAANGDAETACRAAHTLKGASANVGAVALSAVCAEMEEHARARQIAAVEQLCQPLDEAFARACTELKALAREA